MPKVDDPITTDGFLHPNAVLESEGLMAKKGFPESYDGRALLRFLSDIKAGRHPARAPVYSHLVYDVMPNEWEEIDRPEILFVEGLNVLQTGRSRRTERRSRSCRISSIFPSTSTPTRTCCATGTSAASGAARDRVPPSKSYFQRYAKLTDAEVATATAIWTRINLVNLHDNILPTRQRADLILTKGNTHQVVQVALRKL